MTESMLISKANTEYNDSLEKSKNNLMTSTKMTLRDFS